MRHAGGAACPIAALPVAVIEPAFGAALMTGAGAPATAAAAFEATEWGTVAMAVVTGTAEDEEALAARAAPLA
jgi:hypothetical protein